VWADIRNDSRHEPTLAADTKGETAAASVTCLGDETPVDRCRTMTGREWRAMSSAL